MQVTKQRIVNVLRNMGYPELADEASRTLSDPVDTDTITEFCEKAGLSRDELISRMGGSP